MFPQTKHKPNPKSDTDMFYVFLEGATGWSSVPVPPPPQISGGTDGRDLLLTTDLPLLWWCDCWLQHTASLGLKQENNPDLSYLLGKL